MKRVLLLFACAAALPVKDKLHDLGLEVKELEKTWTGGGNLPGRYASGTARATDVAQVLALIKAGRQECDRCIDSVRQMEQGLTHIAGDHLGWCCNVCENGGTRVQTGGVGRDFEVDCMDAVQHTAMKMALKKIPNHLQAMEFAKSYTVTVW